VLEHWKLHAQRRPPMQSRLPATTSIGGDDMKSIALAGLIAWIVTLLGIGVAVAQDTSWKDCELAARNPDRSIAACSKLLKRPSTQAHAEAFHHHGQAYAAKGKLDQAISDISAGIRIDPLPAYRWQERGELYALSSCAKKCRPPARHAEPVDTSASHLGLPSRPAQAG
jgi:tetratricopeptide (TPR) repeat protein